MSTPRLELALLAETLAICRLEAQAPIPAWAGAGSLSSITRTGEELSIVCAASAVPADVRREAGWRCLQVAGPLDFALTGILAALVVPLREAGISIFALSTYDTDYILVKEQRLQEALEALAQAGHHIRI